MNTEHAECEERLRLNMLFAPVLAKRVREQREAFSFWRRQRLTSGGGGFEARKYPETNFVAKKNTTLGMLLRELELDKNGWCFTVSKNYRAITLLRKEQGSVIANTYIVVCTETARKLATLARSLGVLVESQA